MEHHDLEVGILTQAVLADERVLVHVAGREDRGLGAERVLDLELVGLGVDVALVRRFAEVHALLEPRAHLADFGHDAADPHQLEHHFGAQAARRHHVRAQHPLEPQVEHPLLFFARVHFQTFGFVPGYS